MSSDQSVDQIENMLALDPQRVDLREIVLGQYLEAGGSSAEDARRHINWFVSHQPFRRAEWKSWSVPFMRSGKDEIKAVWLKHLSSNCSDVAKNAGAFFASLDPEFAKACWRQAIALNPLDLEAKYDLAFYLVLRETANKESYLLFKQIFDFKIRRAIPLIICQSFANANGKPIRTIKSIRNGKLLASHPTVLSYAVLSAFHNDDRNCIREWAESLERALAKEMTSSTTANSTDYFAERSLILAAAYLKRESYLAERLQAVKFGDFNRYHFEDFDLAVVTVLVRQGYVQHALNFIEGWRQLGADSASLDKALSVISKANKPVRDR